MFLLASSSQAKNHVVLVVYFGYSCCNFLYRRQILDCLSFTPSVSGEEKVTLTAKVPIPVDEKPDFNWVGRIIGPGAVTLKNLENKSGCKVSLRGKGSVRESEVREKYVLIFDGSLRCGYLVLPSFPRCFARLHQASGNPVWIA